MRTFQDAKAMAKLNVEPDHQMSCSFCGKSRHEVRSLIEGGCRNRRPSPCVFICDECVTFSAQVIADLGGNATRPQDLALS